MSKDLSRRQALQTLTAGSAIALAGCSLTNGSGDEQSVSCSSFDYANEQSAPLVEVSVAPDIDETEQVTLEVVLDRSELERSDAAVINAYNPYDEVQNPRHTIPITQQGEPTSGDGSEDDGRMTKETTIGTPPATGILRVAVEDESGTEIAFERFSFECE